MSTPSRTGRTGPHGLLGLAGLTTAARQWLVESQQVARRNAMVAATACARRRIEREDVADFLRQRYQPAEADTAGDPAGDPGSVTAGDPAGPAGAPPAAVRHAHG